MNKLIRSGGPIVMEATIDQLSAYELERGKPMPDTIHAAIQSNIGFEIKLNYREIYRVLSELSLATVPDGTTPDLAIYSAFPLDYEHRTAKRTDLQWLVSRSPGRRCGHPRRATGTPDRRDGRQDWYILQLWRPVVLDCGPCSERYFCLRPGHYEFFHGDDTVRDPNLSLELPLSAIFE